jgi:hypothetical protein
MKPHEATGRSRVGSAAIAGPTIVNTHHSAKRSFALAQRNRAAQPGRHINRSETEWRDLLFASSGVPWFGKLGYAEPLTTGGSLRSIRLRSGQAARPDGSSSSDLLWTREKAR